MSESEAAGILYMREEEKLARDVYTVLYEKWGLPVFSNVARSETTHMAAVAGLLDRYGLTDPAEGKEIGEFTNAELQELYDQLVEQGMRSLDDALRVGAAIEEIDILDLETYVAQTDNADVRSVYANLTKGSRNHLRAFTSQLSRRGQEYAPLYLTAEAYAEIVGSPTERGK